MTLLIPLILATTALAQPGASAPPPAPAPGMQPPPAAAQIPAGEFESADALLTALETADKAIETFHAGLVYDKIFLLQGDRQTRFGDLYYRVDGTPPAPPGAPAGQPPLRTFAIHFTKLLLDGAMRDEAQTWIFDGHWLVEKRFVEKQYVAHEMTRPGSHIDPLRLGEGPLPIPIGQRKADILARYDVELRPTGDGFDPDDQAQANYLANLTGATQILLTPRPGRTNDDFTSIRLWYRHNADGLLLPILARTFSRGGDETFVQLTNIRINQPIPGDVIDITEPAPDSGWDVQIERYRADDTDEADAARAPAPQADAAQE